MFELTVPVLNNAVSLFLAFVMLGAAWHKLRAPNAFAEVLTAYALLPDAWIPAVCRGLPVLELACGLLLLPGGSRTLGALATASILVLYLCAMSINLLRGRRDLDCGCSMQGGAHSLGGADLFRNLALILLCAAVSVSKRVMPAPWIHWFTAIGTAAVMVIFYLAIEQLLSNAQRLDRLRTVPAHD
jgi:Methylamine utilisation protein MauE